MAKSTLTKLYRKFEKIKVYGNQKEVTERVVELPAQQRFSVGKCFVCHEPVMVSEGQLYTFRTRLDGVKEPVHKKCKKLK